jgi:hypothetical protein
MSKLNEMTISEFTDVFNYLLDNNKQLQEKGLTPIAIGLEGAAGIGKTSLIQQVAEKRGMTLCKLNLAQLEEVGDLVGFPQKEVLLQWKTKDGQTKTKWWPESLLKQVPQNVIVTNHTRMGYATPAWLPREENPNGCILALDDYTRASQLFMQATMELINEGKYISWSLPKNTTICLTTNPDDGEFSVQSLDSAQKTRFVNFNLKLNVNDWASWAEFNQIDSRAINFCLLYGEEIFRKHNNVQTINPRAYTTFCKAISGIKDWNNDSSLGLILNLAKGCFLNDSDNVVGTLFTTFIAQKLDKLVQPSDMLMQKWETVEPKIHDCVYDGEQFKPEIASILAIRLLNYIMFYFSQKGVKESVVQDRILEFIDNPRKLFSDDLLFHIIKTTIAKFPAKTTKLLLNAKIRNKITI